ncbi:MAG: hypothetical protein H7X86_05670 [Gorillibacterium sp.]|nr:hypothetical protein [Gorillibacterium sp.]
MGQLRIAEVAKREEVLHDLRRWIGEEATDIIKSESHEELERLIQLAMAAPICMERPLWWAWMTTYCVTEEIRLFEQLRIPQDAKILEIASGDQIAVPLAVECYTKGQGSYTTANLNEELTNHFRQAANKLTIPLHVIEDDALRLGQHVPPATFDVAIFQHAVNDIIQSIVAEQIDLDTVHSNWFEILPDMVKEIARRHLLGTLEDSVKPAFLAVIHEVTRVMKDGGVLFFTHWEYEADLNLDYPPDLYRSFIPLARRWITDSEIPVEELTLEGFDHQYRLILTKKSKASHL